jgi:hypothetical protein
LQKPGKVGAASSSAAFGVIRRIEEAVLRI